jgi:hypothetical protein
VHLWEVSGVQRSENRDRASDSRDPVPPHMNFWDMTKKLPSLKKLRFCRSKS